MTSTTIPGVRSWQRFAITNTLTKAIADRMPPTISGRVVTTGDLGLQMIDASPAVRIRRAEVS